MPQISEVANSVKRVDTILISQPKPERSPYYRIEEKYGIQIDWRPFIHVEGVTEKEFRKTRIRPEEFPCVIMTSRNAIEHYFRMLEEMRLKVNPDTRYFCNSHTVANYLQKFIQYRKRKVFVGERNLGDIKKSFAKFSKERFLFPCSNLGNVRDQSFLDSMEVDYVSAMMYRTVSSDLSDLADITYDVLVFFSPLGIKSLYENFPDFMQNDTRLAVFGKTTKAAVDEKGLVPNIQAPSPDSPSMSMALENYIKQVNV